MLRILGARVNGFRPELVLAITGVIVPTFAKYGYDVILRFGIDGVHSAGSEHYTGLAGDFRMHHVLAAHRGTIVAEIKSALGPDYDVLHEAVGTDNEHLHVEFDPKAPY